MKLSIYEVYVNIEDQPQADRMKQICIDYGLPYWGHKLGWYLNCKPFKKYFCFSSNYQQFWIMYKKSIKRNKKTYTQVTESEFLELVKAQLAN